MCLVIPDDFDHLRFGALESFIIGIILGLLVVGVPSYIFYLYLQKSQPADKPNPPSLLHTIEAETAYVIGGAERYA